ncbi:hypothetical protein JL720_14628 [Aureococcus anophagefferens]|nr:hypothetical protein JL720_14628 [Aureococcus anophagefferens]
MGYVEDETREKQRADLRELGGTLREFAELEARRRNWGPAQRRLGLAMSAWQFFLLAAPPPAQSPAAPSPGEEGAGRAAPKIPGRRRSVPDRELRRRARPDPLPSPSRFPAPARAPASPDRASASTASVRAPRRGATPPAAARPTGNSRRVGRDDPDGDFKDLAHDKFAVYALTWPPKRARASAGPGARRRAANRVNNRKTISRPAPSRRLPPLMGAKWHRSCTTGAFATSHKHFCAPAAGS